MADTNIEIFRAGTHTAMSGEAVTVTTADLAEIAAAYDPAVHEAPLVIGHPETNAPAYGWVKGLTVSGDRLVATPHQVDPAFAEMVRRGAYKKRSASFWGVKTPGNPTPGKLALRHVGFLGAVAPAVKGLREVAFADGDAGGMITFEFAEPRQERPKMNEETKQALEAARAETRKLQEQLALAEADKGKLAGTLAEFAERDRSNRRAADRTRLDGLVKDGKVLPREAAPLTALLQFLDQSKDGVVEFADGSGTVKVAPKEMLFDLLSKRPKIVDFSERATGAGAGTIDFGDPVAISDAAQAYAAEMEKRGTPVTSATAVLHVMKGNRS